jgi:hypothetical protein
MLGRILEIMLVAVIGAVTSVAASRLLAAWLSRSTKPPDSN